MNYKEILIKLTEMLCKDNVTEKDFIALQKIEPDISDAYVEWRITPEEKDILQLMHHDLMNKFRKELRKESK